MSSVTKSECTVLRNALDESIKLFNQCTMINAVPVKMCSNCIESYVLVVQGFRDLESTPDPFAVRTRCVDHFMNQDSLNIIWKQYENSRNLWNEAACTSNIH